MNFKGTILLVDDEPHIRKFFTLIVRQLGTPRLIEAVNGKLALETYEREKPDLVLLDISMPIMDGLKLVKRIRSDQVHKDTPIVIITTEGSQEDRQRALQLGANAYITKPIQAPQVIAKVKELLKLE